MNRRTLTHNPPWANHILAGAWSQLQAEVPQWLPRLEAVTASESGISADLPDYGCGNFGCVYPTIAAGVVMKMTTDDTEAEFATKFAPSLSQPICTVYYKVMPIDAPDNPNIYLLWREEATLVGKIYDVIEEEFGGYLARFARELLEAQHASAQIAYAIMLGDQDQLLVTDDFVQGLTPDQVSTLESGDLSRAVEAWVTTVRDLATCGLMPLEVLFAGILEVYSGQRIFFGDLHDDNLGAVWRGEGATRARQWVITDPGQIAVLRV